MTIKSTTSTTAGTWFIVVCSADFERLDGVEPGVRAGILGGGATPPAAMSSACRRAGALLTGVRVVPWAGEGHPEGGVCYRDAAGQPWHGGSLRRKQGDLHDYETGDFIRPATSAEVAASRDAASRDGGAGVIRVDGRRYYVAE